MSNFYSSSLTSVVLCSQVWMNPNANDGVTDEALGDPAQSLLPVLADRLPVLRAFILHCFCRSFVKWTGNGTYLRKGGQW